MTGDKFMKPSRITLTRFSGEAVLIVASVFIAISLESMWQDRSDAEDANIALTQLLRELRADQAFLDQVEVEQKRIGKMNADLLTWFADPESVPVDSVHSTLEEYSMGITMWPRRAAWTTMVAAGQLNLLGDRSLAISLGNYYEHTLRRLEYNGEQYDADFGALIFGSIPRIWDFQHGGLLTSDSERIAEFRNQVRRIDVWTQWYLSSIEINRIVLSALIQEVELYLQSQGHAA